MLSPLLLLGAALAASPSHLLLARFLVDTLAPEDNTYGSDPTFVYWQGLDGQSRSQNQSKCSSFLSTLLTRAYAADMTEWMGCSSPVAQRYFDAISAEDGFTWIDSLSQIQPGDIIAISYGCAEATCGSVGSCSSSGHVAIVSGVPRHRKTPTSPVVEGTLQFDVPIIDSTSSHHGSIDTRYESENDGSDDSGVGEGVMRLYLDPSDGSIAGYTWSTYSSSVYYDQGTRPLVVGRYAR